MKAGLRKFELLISKSNKKWMYSAVSYWGEVASSLRVLLQAHNCWTKHEMVKRVIWLTQLHGKTPLKWQSYTVFPNDCCIMVLEKCLMVSEYNSDGKVCLSHGKDLIKVVTLKDHIIRSIFLPKLLLFRDKLHIEKSQHVLHEEPLFLQLGNNSSFLTAEVQF